MSRIAYRPCPFFVRKTDEPGRVQIRTSDWPHGAALVRLCTRDVHVCAKSDTRLTVPCRSCPLVHTGRSGVCEIGHENADSGGRASVCAHGTWLRVQIRTRVRPRSAARVRLCTPSSAPCAQADTTTGEGPRTPACTKGQRPTGSRGRLQLFL